LGSFFNKNKISYSLGRGVSYAMTIWRMSRVLEGSAVAPLGESRLEIAGSGEIWSCAPIYFSGRLLSEGAFQSSAGGYYHETCSRSVVLSKNDMKAKI
jgi:hypothetical protein